MFMLPMRSMVLSNVAVEGAPLKRRRAAVSL